VDKEGEGEGVEGEGEGEGEFRGCLEVGFFFLNRLGRVGVLGEVLCLGAVGGRRLGKSVSLMVSISKELFLL